MRRAPLRVGLLLGLACAGCKRPPPSPPPVDAASRAGIVQPDLGAPDLRSVHAPPDAATPAKPAAPATPAAAPAPPTAIRLVLVRDEELLRSEARDLDELKRHFARDRRFTFTFSEADPGERAALAAWFGAPPSPPPASLPPAWGPGELVIAFHNLAPIHEKRGRISRGVGSVVAFRPPSVEPIYVERVEGDAASGLGQEFVQGLFEIAGGGK